MLVGATAANMTPAATDAPPSARVREAGCILLGKTAMPDFDTLGSGISSLHGSQCAYEDTLKVLRLVDRQDPVTELTQLPVF